MIQKNSIVRCGDNSGVSFLKCIGILGKNKISKLLNFIKFSVKKFSKFKKRRVVKVKKSLVYKGLIVSLNFFLERKNGFFIKFDSIRIVSFLNNKLLGTRIYCNLFKEIKLFLFINKKKSDLIRKIILKAKFIF